MAANNYGLNSTTRQGEGEANILQWGATDRASNQIYQEQRQREARGYNEYLQGQKLLQVDLSKLRGADINDAVKEYGEVKRAKQKLQFDPKLRNNPTEYAKAQLEVQKLESEFRTNNANSIEAKENDKVLVSRLLTHPDEFDVNESPKLAIHMKMSLKERAKIGAIGNVYAYKGLDLPKLASWTKAAAGSQQDVEYGEKVKSKDGYKYEQQVISRGNNPIKFGENLYNSLLTNKGSQGAAIMIKNMPTNEINSIISKFDAIPDAEFKGKWGVTKDEVRNNDGNTDDKVGQYVMLTKMKYATDNLPQVVRTKTTDNEAQNFADKLTMNKITSAQAKERAIIVASKKEDPLAFANKGVQVLQTRNPKMIDEFLGSVFGGSSSKDILDGNTGYTGAVANQDGTITIKYTTKEGKIAFDKTKIINPDSPLALSEIVSLQQELQGSNVKVEEALRGKATAKPTNSTIQVPKSTKKGIIR